MNNPRNTRTLPSAFIEARPAGQRKGLEVRARMPKCGAKSRVTGEPCRQPVKEEGKRCRYHGGATPKGKDWHRRRIGRKGQSAKSFAGKLRALERRDREAEERRAAMTPEERAAHEKRRVPKRPGTLAERDSAARGRQMAKEIDGMLSKTDEPSEEAQRLEAEILELEKRKKASALPIDAPDDDDSDDDPFTKGIFG